RALGYLQRYDHPASVEGAIRLLEQLLASNDGDAHLHAALARACLHQYRLTAEPRWEARAASECQRALTLDAGASDVRVTLGDLHASTGRHADAVRAYREALELASDRVEAWLGLSLALE